MKLMIRMFQRAAMALVLGALAAPPALAKDPPKAKPAAAGKVDSAKPDKGKKADAGKKAEAGKSTPVASFGDWSAYATQGKPKTCYVAAEPKDRAPADLKRDHAYVFIAARPGENVHNEVSVIMGFAMTDAKVQAPKAPPSAEIGSASFELVAKGSNAWLKNPAEEGRFVETMKKGAKLVVHATSLKGNATTDSYSLSGFSDALARIHKDCQ